MSEPEEAGWMSGKMIEMSMSEQEMQERKKKFEDEAVATHEEILTLYSQIEEAKKRRTAAFRRAKAAGVPASTLAERTGISRPLVTRILAGDR